MDFFLGITNKCNLSCPWCAHKNLINLDKEYEMSENEFETWFNYTKKAKYFFESIDFNGLGEPTQFSNISLFKYMLIKCRKFTTEINILSNGTNLDYLSELLPFVDNINISMWKQTKNKWNEIEVFANRNKKVHLKYDIELHDIRNKVDSEYSYGKNIKCGCSGCGYTMDTVFLVCGTWCPSIVKNDLYHTELKENYLSTLSEYYDYAAFPMCSSCWANTSIPYKKYDI